MKQRKHGESRKLWRFRKDIQETEDLGIEGTYVRCPEKAENGMLKVSVYNTGAEILSSVLISVATIESKTNITKYAGMVIGVLRPRAQKQLRKGNTDNAMGNPTRG